MYFNSNDPVDNRKQVGIPVQRPTRFLALHDFYGRVRGVIDSRDDEFLNDFDALQRIRELIAAYEATKEECN